MTHPFLYLLTLLLRFLGYQGVHGFQKVVGGGGLGGDKGVDGLLGFTLVTRLNCLQLLHLNLDFVYFVAKISHVLLDLAQFLIVYKVVTQAWCRILVVEKFVVGVRWPICGFLGLVCIEI